MERPLQILHLSQDFRYRATDGENVAPERSFIDAPAAPGTGSPSAPSDAIRVYELGPCLDDGPDGPRLARAPTEPPLLARAKEDLPEGDGSYILRSGDYVFRQRSDAGEEDMPAILEAFLRDSWWEGRGIPNRVVARRVREDGRTALQLWARKDSPR